MEAIKKTADVSIPRPFLFTAQPRVPSQCDVPKNRPVSKPAIESATVVEVVETLGGPQIEVRLLGRPELRVVGQGGSLVLSIKDAILIALLALDGPQDRGHVARLLWPDATPAKALTNLRQRAHRLRALTERRIFEIGSQPELSIESGLVVDALRIDRMSISELGDCGAFLAGVEVEEGALSAWLARHRTECSRMRARTLLVHADAAHRLHDQTTAIRLASEAMALAEGDEQAASQLIRLQLSVADQSSAIRTYRIFEATRSDPRGPLGPEMRSLRASLESYVGDPKEQSPYATRLRIEKTVFISYRRSDKALAFNVYQWLTQRGYDVFIDYEGIGSGSFEVVIIENILARAHFLVVLSPAALDRCSSPKDWLRREAETAMDAGRNVVPLLIDGFDFASQTVQSKLTGKLFHLQAYNGLAIAMPTFFDQMEQLVRRFLNVPLDAVIHPPSVRAVRAAREQQASLTTEELRQTREELLRTSGELERMREALSDYQCPHCGALLVERGSGSEAVEYRGREVDLDHVWESFECGFSVTDGREQSLCRNTSPAT